MSEDVSRPGGPVVPRALVHLTVEGGFAALPGLARPAPVDTEELEPDARAELLGLLGAAGLLPGTSVQTSPPPAPTRGADRQTYTVTVACGGEERSVQVVDPVTVEPYRTLVRTLRRLTRPGR